MNPKNENRPIAQRPVETVLDGSLLPYPFCGSNAEIFSDRILFFTKAYRVTCTYSRCPAMITTGAFHSEKDAIRA